MSCFRPQECVIKFQLSWQQEINLLVDCLKPFHVSKPRESPSTLLEIYLSFCAGTKVIQPHKNYHTSIKKKWNTHCLLSGSFSANFSRTLISSFAASRYLSTFLMILRAMMLSLKKERKNEKRLWGGINPGRKLDGRKDAIVFFSIIQKPMLLPGILG